MDMPTISETAASERGSKPTPAPAENPRAADVRRASRPHGTETVVNNAATDRSYGRDGGETHEHKLGGVANRLLKDSSRKMLENLDKFGDVNGDAAGGGRREGVSTNGTSVVETAGGASPEKPAQKPDGQTEGGAAPGSPASEPAAGDQPAEDSKPAETKEAAPAEKPPEKPPEKPADTTPDPKLTAEVQRLSEHNRKLVAELEARGAPQLDDRMKALDGIERMAIEDPIGALEKLFTLAIGAKDHTDPAVQRFMAGAYGDWTERELKVPMDKAARAEFGSERNRLLIQRDRREREAGEKTTAEKTKAAERERTVRDVVGNLDRQLAAGKHAEKYPLLMQAEVLDGVTPGQKLFTAISRGIAAGDWDKVPADDVLVEHYSKQLEKELQTKDQKLRAFYAKQTPTSTATPTQPSDSSKEKAADAPAKPAEQAGARTITNASASVAPPTPPKEAAATPPAKDDAKPKWRNEAERRLYLARQHFGDA